MRTVIISALVVVLLFVSGCSFLAGQRQAVNEQGKPLFVTEGGKVTTEAVDPVSGKAYAPLMEYREDGGIVADATGVVRGILPPPWGEIAGAIGGLAALGVGTWARKKNAEAKAGRELVGQIEKSPEVKKVVKEKLATKASENLKSFVRKVTEKKAA